MKNMKISKKEDVACFDVDGIPLCVIDEETHEYIYGS